MDRESRKFLCRFRNLKDVGECSENVGATRPHVSVVGEYSEECTKLFHVLGGLHCKNDLIFFGYGLIPRRVSQCPRKLVSWMAHLHLQGLMTNPFSQSGVKTLLINFMCESKH